jgi:hypothetical protein
MEIIDSMVNFETLELKGQDPDSEISFPTSTHQKFFNVLLVDFLSFIVQIAASPLSVNPPVVTAFSSGASIAARHKPTGPTTKSCSQHRSNLPQGRDPI